jgi:colanic acid biosynthesis glycosyl transferase WcaI
MRVIVWGINYAPEVVGIAPFNKMLCDFLCREEHDVEMVTTFAYYPAWKKRSEDYGELYRTDIIDEIKVHRCWHYVPAKVSALKRILHEGSFTVTSFLRALTLKKGDVYMVISPPLLLGAAAWVVTKVKRSVFVFHVQDLQPDAALGLGMLKPSLFTRLLYWLEDLAYRKAAAVSGISKGMLDAFRRKGVPESKLIYFPNAVEVEKISGLPSGNSFRNIHGYSRDDFIAVYSGNLGMKQGLETLVEAARLLSNERLKIVICGEGAERERLQRLIGRYQLDNIRMLPLQSEENYRAMLLETDLSLITQQKGSGQAFFPSKLLKILAHGKPVLTVADSDSELSRAIAEGRFGVSVTPGSPEQLASALGELSADVVKLKAFGEAGKRYVEQFRSETVLSNFAAQLQAVAASSKRS